ncbi:hypothetical protein B0H10DRAFT_1290355 [Mycena sp. CBHHK59/15]|nr:hypothetical protein B0H10DRAFT_1290355 [Mycena sp. CBHHK59/15]
MTPTMPTSLAVATPDVPPPTSSGAGADSSPPRVLRRDWKEVKPHLPKSTSLPAFQLAPRDRPRFTCRECGFTNFYNIPMCVWCAEEGPEAAARDFERTVPRARTASAPPRVFWTPNELSPRPARRGSLADRRASESACQPLGATGDFCAGPSISGPHRFGRFFQRKELAPTKSQSTQGEASASLGGSSGWRPQSLLDPPPLSIGRPQMHRRAHSQPNALRIGHPRRPYYSAIRKDTAPSNLAAPNPRAHRRPASLALAPPSAFPNYAVLASVPIDDEGEKEALEFEFVSSPVDDTRRKRHSATRFSFSLGSRLASPVSALHAMNREAEMRAALAQLARESRDPDIECSHEGTVGAQLRKLGKGLKGLVRRNATH